MAWQDAIDDELEQMSGKDLTVQEWGDWQWSLQQRILADWWRLADSLVVKWNDFERTADGKIGSAWSYPEDWSRMIGMTTDVHPNWVQPASEPVPPPQGYKPATVSLPRVWDAKANQWDDWSTPPQGLAAGFARQDAPLGHGTVQAVVTGAALFLVGSLSGFAAGRRRPAKTAAEEPLLA